jgi:CheY-like chemotaxis protein
MASLVAFLDDLMFLSRVREAARAQGLQVREVRRSSELLPACSPPPRAVIVDLDSLRLPALPAIEALRSDPGLANVPIVGFFSHVHAERARAARAAGCDQVLARSAFVQELPGLLATLGSSELAGEP